MSSQACGYQAAAGVSAAHRCAVMHPDILDYRWCQPLLCVCLVVCGCNSSAAVHADRIWNSLLVACCIPTLAGQECCMVLHQILLELKISLKYDTQLYCIVTCLSTVYSALLQRSAIAQAQELPATCLALGTDQVAACLGLENRRIWLKTLYRANTKNNKLSY